MDTNTALQTGIAVGIAINHMKLVSIHRHLRACPVCAKKSTFPLAGLASLLIFATAGAGCVRMAYTASDGAKFTYNRPAFGKVVVGKLDVTRGTNTLHLEGYQSDQVEAAKAIAEGVATGLAKAVKP